MKHRSLPKEVLLLFTAVGSARKNRPWNKLKEVEQNACATQYECAETHRKEGAMNNCPREKQ